jgi:hypothetical protein
MSFHKMLVLAVAMLAMLTARACAGVINFPVPIHDIFDAQTALSQRVDNPLDGATAAYDA